MRALALLAATLAAASCTPSFQAADQVTDLRVLAIRTEPPDAVVPDGGPVPDVRVTVLVADAAKGRACRVSGAVCFPSDTLRCDGGPSLPTPTVTGPVGELGFAVKVPQQAIVAALQDDRLKGLGGVRVQLSLLVDDGDVNGPVSAAKVLLYNADHLGYVRNHTPEVIGFQVFRGGAPSQLDAGQPLVLQGFNEVGLRPILGPGDGTQAIEEYDAVDLTGKPYHAREQLVYSFFSTEGAQPDRERVDEPLPDQPPLADGLVRFSAYTPGASGSLWVVVRDGRGGESWLTVPWSVQP